MHHDLILLYTNRTAANWMDFIQEAIVRHTKPTDDPNHGLTESVRWLNELSEAVWARLKEAPDFGKTDENVAFATVMSLILTLWSVRLRRTKTHDPRRPIFNRQMAYRRLVEHQLALVSCLVDQSEDHKYFPLPHWDDPFDPTAVNGDFV